MGLFNFIKRYKADKKIGGRKFAFQHAAQRMIGVDQRIDSLEFFLNNIHSPSEMSPTTDPDLRILQECDVLLLKLFKMFCERHDLTFWLDYGTLLGAVRHKGFIPWDDDMDVAMLRHEYNKVKELLQKDFDSFGFHTNEPLPGRRIGFGYHHSETGIWLDIFPVDVVKTQARKDKQRCELIEKICKYRAKYKKKLKHENGTVLARWRDKLINDSFAKGEFEIYYHGPEFYYNLVHDQDEIFPLEEGFFEGLSMPVPNKAPKYLNEIYGRDFMQFPKSGILKHDLGRGPLSTWAKKNSYDMKIIKAKIEKIIKEYNELNQTKS